MKVQTINIRKGGTGKSTVAFNYASYLAKVKNKKVLIIDGDNSCNLSYSIGDIEGKTIFDLFDTGKTEIIHAKPNIDIIYGSEFLTDDDLDLKSKENNKLQLFMWLIDNPEIEETYDYMIIDTHNDNTLVTANFIAVADQVFSVSDPSKNGWRAWETEKLWIDYLKNKVVEAVSRKSYIVAEPFLVGNKIEFIGNNMPGSSGDFVDMAKTDDRYLGFIPKKELFSKALLTDESIYDQWENMSDKQREEHLKFYNQVSSLFEKMSEL